MSRSAPALAALALFASAATAAAQAPRATPAPIPAGATLAHHHLRRPSRRLRARGRRRRRQVGGAPATSQVRLRHQRRHRPLGDRRRAAGPAPPRGERSRRRRILGIETEVLDNHDGELMPTLENRRTITRLIREWQADIVISHRPNDYHPDHRYTGVLVQDAAYMVTVPFFCPDVPPLDEQPGLPLLRGSASRSRTRSPATSWSASTT